MTEDIVVSVVLPTYNEAQNITELIRRTDATLPMAHEIIVVDDDSHDKTWEIAQSLNLQNVRVIRRINERKLVSAIQRGIDESKGKYIVWLDADLSMPPELIPQLIEQLDNYSIAVGSRYAKGGKDQRPLLRIVSSRFINLIANIILNFKVKDYDSGFVAARKEVLNDIRLSENAGYGEYCIDFLYKAGKKYSITEIPYTFIDRRAGESKTAKTLFGLFKYGMLYLKKIIRLRFT
jgi:dolichol-phosphate mannosyltransferase